MLFKLIYALLGLAVTALASSLARNQLNSVETLQDSTILTSNRRVNAYSHFDLDFRLRNGQDEIRLSLEPNEDALGHGATVTYLGADGQVTYMEPFQRHEHKVYKGIARAKSHNGEWINVGWARISVLRDGTRPLFEGAFALYEDKHHIQLPSTFLRSRHELDPEIEETDDEYMILWRDSDVASHSFGRHDDLKRGLAGKTCAHDELEFNARADHPVYLNMLKRREEKWGEMSMRSALGKRQIDTQGSGNGAGVNLISTIGSTAGCPSTRKVALVGVATDCGYTTKVGNLSATKDHVIGVMNQASAIWESTFNVSLGLQNLTISEAACPASPQTATPWNQDCDSTLDIAARLNLFSAWRGTLRDQNSHWTLLTSCPTGSAVGLAWLGQACVHDAITSNSSSGSETVSGANVVAMTSTEWEVIAHETGHTFGAVHDCTADTCASNTTVAAQQCCPLSQDTCSAGSQFIMNPYTVGSIKAFSACTVGNICSAIRYNSVNTTCLSDNRGIVTISGATCGNGIVEAGEDCDCGGEASCGDDPCCNPTTCKFAANAVCDDANEACCKSCQYANNGTVCRPSTGICDPSETCTGQSASCPADITAPNGQSCALPNNTATDLTCASGQCTSRNLQCQTVMAGYITSSSSSSADSPGSISACDHSTCLLSCSSPSFGPGVCYGLQQNLLDGTPCGGGGGGCVNGVCRGGSTAKEIGGWIQDHKGVVIGVASTLGVLALLTLCAWLSRCLASGRDPGKLPQRASNGSMYNMVQQPYGANSPRANQYPRTFPPPMLPHSPYTATQQDFGWRPPQPPPHYHTAHEYYGAPQIPMQHGLHGQGLFGGRSLGLGLAGLGGGDEYERERERERERYGRPVTPPLRQQPWFGEGEREREPPPYTSVRASAGLRPSTSTSVRYA